MEEGSNLQFPDFWEFVFCVFWELVFILFCLRKQLIIFFGARMRDQQDVSAEATEDGSIGADGMQLWKVVTDVRSGDD